MIVLQPRRSLGNALPPQQQQQQPPMLPGQQIQLQQQQQLYDSVNCDYEPAGNFQQNFGNPYDCPEGMYGGSMVSSVGYSKVKKCLVKALKI